MTEDWRVYPCSMGNSPATVAFDFGVHEDIDALPETVVRLRVAFREPDPGGMPQSAEFAALNAVEDRVRSWMAERGGRQVGRVTVGGHSHLIYYADVAEADIFALRHAVDTELGYALAWNVEKDSERIAYWRDLYPSVEDWRVMADFDIINQLHAAGVDISAPRHINHGALFLDGGEATAFGEWAVAVGYDDVRTVAPDHAGGEHAVLFSHQGPPNLHEITGHTLRLRAQAEKMGGRYDGWGTPVATEA